MEEWQKTRERYKVKEGIGMIGILFCLVLGIGSDYTVIARRCILIHMEDIESFSLTILQIQATVGTLIVAVIALITGNISDSYMGVSVSDFYLNIKPWKLKQKTLMFASLGFCFFGVILHSLGLYNTVFFLFAATLIVVSISIDEIYSAFRGKNKENLEIEAYINYVLKSDTPLKEKINIYQNFVSDFKRIVNEQDKQNYEKYLGFFEECMSIIADYQTEEGLKIIQQQCYNMSYCLLGSEKKTINERGIGFVHHVYNVMWKIICKNITKENIVLNKYKKGFFFFSEISSELIQSIERLNIESVEKNLRFNDLTDKALRTVTWFRYDADENRCDNQEDGDSLKNMANYGGEVSELKYFARCLGYYINKQKNRGNIVNQGIWENTLKQWGIFSTYNISEERCEEFLNAKASIYFNYCYGMLLAGQEQVVKEGLYLAGMNSTVKLDNKYQALFYLSVHCYIYYLAKRENYVLPSIKKAAEDILCDKKVKDSFDNVLNMLAENVEWIDEKLREQMHKMLKGYELFPAYNEAKWLIMENVVSDFYVFLVLFIAHEYSMSELLGKGIDDKREFSYVTDTNVEKTKEMLKSLFEIIYIGEKTESQINTEVGLMYAELEKVVMKKQKERHIVSASHDQQKYEESVNEEEICKRIKEDVIKRIKEKFTSFLIDEDKTNRVLTINLLTLNDFTSSLCDKKLNGYYSHIDGMFLWGIQGFLYEQGKLEQKNRFSDFSNGKEYIEYLKTNGLEVLLGSQYILENKEYKYADEFKEYLENCEMVYTPIMNTGMALKKNSVHVCLHDVNVTIHSPSIEESGATYDEETGKYKYSIMSGLLNEFDENELKEFLHNSRKVINVTADISVRVSEENIGTIFVGRGI